VGSSPSPRSEARERLGPGATVELAREVLEKLVCPKCKGPLEHRTAPTESLVCHQCRLIYAVEDDIPIMLIDEAKSF